MGVVTVEAFAPARKAIQRANVLFFYSGNFLQATKTGNSHIVVVKLWKLAREPLSWPIIEPRMPLGA